MKKELTKKESIKIKCPLCKSKVPSNALRCSKCSGDLSVNEVQEDIQSQLQKQRKIKIAAGLIIGLSILTIIISFGGEDVPKQQNDKSATLSIGEEGILNNQKEKTNCDGNTILSTTKENYDEFSKTMVAEDNIGYLQMIGDGKLFLVENCTKVKVIDSAFALKEVRILEGEYFGTTGWTAYEFAIKENTSTNANDTINKAQEVEYKIIEENDISYLNCKRVGLKIIVPDNSKQKNVDHTLENIINNFKSQGWQNITVWAWKYSEEKDVKDGLITYTMGLKEYSTCN